MITKARLIEQIREFPERLDIDDLIEWLIFINKVEKRNETPDSNDTISEEEIFTSCHAHIRPQK